MPKRLTYEHVKSEFVKKRCTLLSIEYVNSRQKLEYVCSNGHIHSMSWDNFRQGYGCPICRNIKLSKKFSGLGHPMFGRKHTEKSRKKMVKSKMGSKNHMFGKKHTLESRKKMSDAKRGPNNPRFGKFGKDNPLYGRKLSEEVRKKISIYTSGPKNPNWKGGIACEPYCPIWLDKEFKKSILERDNYRCQNTDCWGTSIRLTGHHIDYDKRNCDPSNIITVCGSCNSRSNANREHWTKFYQSIMNEKYGYNYEQSK